MNNPTRESLWSENRDSINLVTGAILGAYLGLSISRQGLSEGSQWDLLALIVFTAYTVGALVTFGNRWFFGNRKIAFGSFVSSGIPIWLSLRSADNLGVDTEIFVTIYLAWVILIVTQIFAHWALEKAKQISND